MKERDATRESIEAALADTVERERAAGGSWWPDAEIAPLAYRRLTTFPRRNESKTPTDEHRVLDLVKGLQAHFEPDVPYTHPNDWRALAAALISAFDATTRSATAGE